MKNRTILLRIKENVFLRISFLLVTIVLYSCSKDKDTQGVTIPKDYTFSRNGMSTVSFTRQTIKIQMAEELTNKLENTSASLTELMAMYAHKHGSNDFSDASLNAFDKSLRSKTAASEDFFSTNTTISAVIKQEFDGWINTQVKEVFPVWEHTASKGVAGQLQEAGGGSIRYVSSKGLEMNQLFAKGLIGALMLDQILNNYLSASVLDAENNIANNNAGILDGTNNYTTMEHRWDEAYGYLYGNSINASMPNTHIGDDDNFLNKYVGKVDSDDDFSTIAEDIFNAFKLGRAAIVAKDYTTRDIQAEILREKLSQIIGIRAVYYLQQAKTSLEATIPDHAVIFHNLSEGYGFIYSLQFTRKPNSSSPYFTRTEVESMLKILAGSTNGLWDVSPAILQNISEQIAAQFSFTVSQAAN